eukprot:jgi/Chrpa1/25801/Chrysochromulina_OHIO_Genome00001615-RA
MSMFALRGDDDNALEETVKALIFAVENDDADGVVQHIAGAYATDENGQTPFLLAVMMGKVAALRAFLDEGVEVDGTQHDPKKGTALGFASRKGNTECAKLLLERKADPNYVDEDRCSPMWWAANVSRPTSELVLQTLLDGNADPNLADKHGVTPILLAYRKRGKKTFQFLLAADGVDLTIVDAKGVGLLLNASDNGDASVLLHCLSAGADPSRPAADGTTPLELARDRAHVAATAILRIATGDAELHDPLTPDELRAVADEGMLEAALPVAFSKSILRSLECAAMLTAGFRSSAYEVRGLDMESGDRLIGQCLKAQQCVVGLLRALDPQCVQRLLHSPRATEAIEALVLAECKTTLSDKVLQEAIHARWSIVMPLSLADALVIALRALWHLGVLAVYPPYQKVLETALVAEQADARRRVEEEHPEPDWEQLRDEHGGDMNADVSLKVGGKMVSSCTVRDLKLESHAGKDALKKFRERRAALATEHAHLVRRHSLILRPEATFYSNLLTQLALGVWLVVLPVKDAPIQSAALFAAMAQFLARELFGLTSVRGRRMWLADPLNWLELGAYSFATLSLSLRLELGRLPELERVDEAALQATSVLLLFTGIGFRFLQRDQKRGPLVMMTVQMMRDVLNFLVLFASILVAFAAAFLVLFKGLEAGGLGEDCAVFDSDGGGGLEEDDVPSLDRSWGPDFGDAASWMIEESVEERTREKRRRLHVGDEDEGRRAGMLWHVGVSVVALFEIMLGSDNPIGCLRASTQPITAPAFMIAYLVVAVLLGTNMLIALMAKTFDLIHEQQMPNFMYLSTLLYLVWSDESPVPAPLLLLRIVFYDLGRLAAFAATNKGSVGTTIYFRPLAVVPPVPVLKEAMEEYLKSCEGGQGEDDKWRSNMLKQGSRIAAQVDEVKEELNAEVTAHVAEIKVQLAEVKAQMGRGEGRVEEMMELLERKLDKQSQQLAQMAQREQQQLALILSKLGIDAPPATSYKSSPAASTTSASFKSPPVTPPPEWEPTMILAEPAGSTSSSSPRPSPRRLMPSLSRPKLGPVD